MRAKFIYEKFTEDSDPIHDMGIGVFTKRNFNNINDIAKLLVKFMPFVLHTDKIPDDIIITSGSSKFSSFRWDYYWELEHYCKKYIRLKNINVGFNVDIFEKVVNILLKMGYPKKILKDNPIFKNPHEKEIYEKFTEEGDPIHDMDIGVSVNLYKKALELTYNDSNNLTGWINYLESLRGKTIVGYFKKGIYKDIKDKEYYKKFKILKFNSHYDNFYHERWIFFIDKLGNSYYVLKNNLYIIR
jgi:hypothetical protein